MGRDDNEGQELMRRQVQSAVAAGMRAAISDPALMEQFWTAAFSAMQQHASREAGKWVLWSLGGLVKRALTFVALGLIVYKLGGWSAVSALGKALFP